MFFFHFTDEDRFFRSKRLPFKTLRFKIPEIDLLIPIFVFSHPKDVRFHHGGGVRISSELRLRCFEERESPFTTNEVITPGGRRVVPCMCYIGMWSCHDQGYESQAVYSWVGVITPGGMGGGGHCRICAIQLCGAIMTEVMIFKQFTSG